VLFLPCHPLLPRSRVTDDGLGLLADACPRLTRLVIWGCTNLSGRFFLGHARARAPNPFSLPLPQLVAVFRGEPVEASGQLSAADARALAMAPLRIYGRPGDVMPAAEYE
jgi:hypothetical protein